MVRTDIELSNASAIAFADDVYTFAARQEGLQEKADIMSASAAILGVFFATQKLRTTAKSWGNEPTSTLQNEYHLTVHDKDWSPVQIPVQYAQPNTDHSFRYLGVHMDVNNTFDNQYSIAQEQVREVAARAHHKLASPDTIAMAIRMSTHRKVSFPGKFAPWSLTEMRKLDIPLSTLYKHHLRFMQSTPTALLHMDKELG
jgi:hypothetical protein